MGIREKRNFGLQIHVLHNSVTGDFNGKETMRGALNLKSNYVQLGGV